MQLNSIYEKLNAICIFTSCVCKNRNILNLVVVRQTAFNSCNNMSSVSIYAFMDKMILSFVYLFPHTKRKKLILLIKDWGFLMAQNFKLCPLHALQIFVLLFISEMFFNVCLHRAKSLTFGSSYKFNWGSLCF